MLRLFTDFQAIEPDGALWILKHEGVHVNKIHKDLNLSNGDSVILDAFEDFELMGVLHFKFVSAMNQEGWVAYPDWTTHTAISSDNKRVRVDNAPSTKVNSR